MNSYEAKQKARRGRLENAAANAQAEASHHFNRVDLSNLPPGQPILVGHYSEGRHRNLLARADNAMRAGFAANERAAELARRAAAVGTGGISSDDPEALDKLREKLAWLQYLQDRMKASNAEFKKLMKAGKALYDFRSASDAVRDAKNGDMTRLDACHGLAFPSHTLTNNGAEIRRLTKRIEELRANATREPSASEQFGDISIEEIDNRVCLFFPGKPSDAIRANLKRNGFKWSPTREAWVRTAGDVSICRAREIAALANAEQEKSRSERIHERHLHPPRVWHAWLR